MIPRLITWPQASSWSFMRASQSLNLIDGHSTALCRQLTDRCSTGHAICTSPCCPLTSLCMLWVRQPTCIGMQLTTLLTHTELTHWRLLTTTFLSFLCWNRPTYGMPCSLSDQHCAMCRLYSLHAAFLKRFQICYRPMWLSAESVYMYLDKIVIWDLITKLF